MPCRTIRRLLMANSAARHVQGFPVQRYCNLRPARNNRR